MENVVTQHLERNYSIAMDASKVVEISRIQVKGDGSKSQIVEFEIWFIT